MFQSDAHVQLSDPLDYTNCLNVDVITEIEKELSCSPYDLTSLVFLLYDVPTTALQRLIVYQQMSQKERYTNFLHEWWQYAKSKATWKHEFIEALLICQLYSIIRKLGLDKSTMKKHYQPDNIGACMYINPLKKALYKLCENINSDNLSKLKHKLQINPGEYKSCESVFLKLMCDKFISIKQYEYDNKIVSYEVDIDHLLSIIEHMPGLETIYLELRKMASLTKHKPENEIKHDDSCTAPVTTEDALLHKSKNDLNHNDLNKSIFEMINKLSINDEVTHYKTDTKILNSEMYPIRNPNKVGVCIIINQENFHPSKESIDRDDDLTERKGSSVDKDHLIWTMKQHNFDVHAKSDLSSTQIFTFIKSVVHEHVDSDTSIIMVCILSHGVRGHIYASNSVKVKVSDIQSYLDSDELSQTRGIPKVFIIQACQVDEHPELPPFVADGPKPLYYLPKSDFLVYWATAAEYEAYRNEEYGSIFIYCLCKTIAKFSKSESIFDIFTRVTNRVRALCIELKLAQVPIFETTLQYKLYLRVPQQSVS